MVDLPLPGGPTMPIVSPGPTWKLMSFGYDPDRPILKDIIKSSSKET